MDTFSAFIPIDRRFALSEGRSLPDRARGAALFADISGFTPLTATLRHELGARRGAEEVIRHLDSVFATLIAQIHRYHGNVIGFSGDAITCWFDDGPQPAPAGTADAATRAVAAAIDLQAVMAHLKAITTPAGTSIPLAIKVAVAAGPVRRFLVGDPQTYLIEVIAGATVDRTSTAEKLANRGEVIVSAEVISGWVPPPAVTEWRAAGGERYAVLATTTPPVQPPPPRVAPQVADEIARPWLLPPVYEHLRQGSAEFLAELRPAVPLFVKFSGIDYDGDDEAGTKLDTFVRHVQAILDRYEGFLVQITMGDKGSYLYITFGAPVAHENDDNRAAAAALEMRELPAKLPFLAPLHISISRGLIHSGAYGGPERRTFAVMGNEVNLSARLMSAAQEGQVLISARVSEAVAEEFDIKELPAIPLKGITDLFAVAELTGRRSVTRATHRVLAGVTSIGREAERVAVDDALAGLMAGNSMTLLIEGAAGMGKSLLIQELAEKALARPNAVVLSGSGDAIERSTPYYGWRPIFEALFVGEDRSDPSWRDRFVERLDPATRSRAPLLNAVLPLDLPDNDLTGQLSGEARQDNTHQVLIDLLSMAAGRPLVLIFDDAHWMDSVSWTLVGRARRELDPVLVILGLRPFGDDAPAMYNELRASTTTRLIEIGTLPPAAIEELVNLRLGVRHLPPAIAQLIHEKAEGHPFFSEELAYALRDAGLLRVVDGEAHVAPGADLTALDFPITIQGVITSRIDRLSPSQQLTVKVASVIGRIFAVQVLDGVYPIEGGAAQLRANLKRLERLDITPEESPEPNLAYIFKHIVTQEVVYSLMTFAQRSQLHRNTALWYENAAEGDQTRNFPLLAHHWRLAGEPEKAMGYYAKAGHNAIRDFANQEAIRFFDQALELSSPAVSPVRRARWHRLLGEAKYRLSLIESSIEENKRALELLGRPIPDSTVGSGVGLGRAMTRQLTHRLRPSHFVGRAAADQREALLEAARVLEGSAEIYYNLGDFLTSFYCTMTAFNLAEQAGPSPELMRGYANMCATLGVVSLNSAADGYRRRALELEPLIDDLPARAWSRIALSTHSVWVANWDRAEKEIGEALAIYTQLGDWRRWGVAAWLWPQVAQSRGQLARARDLWAELYAVATRNRDTRHEVRGRGGQFFNFLALGQPEAAGDCLTAAGIVLADNPEMMPVEDRLWHAANAAWALQEGEWAKARDAARETLAAIGRSRFKFDLLEVFATPAEVLLALWERDEATATETQAACKVLTSYARTYAFARPRALRVRGQYARLAGNPKAAAKFNAKSLAQAEALGMPHERALTEAITNRYREA